MKIFMVCLGNICRSPLAEGILKHKAAQAGLDWHIESCGTGGWHTGEAPDERAQKIALQNGVDISQQRAQKFSHYHFQKFDVIYAMDSSNYTDILKLAMSDEEKNKVDLIMNMAYPGKNMAVPDPYYHDELYQTVFNMLNEACTHIISAYTSIN